MKLKDNRLIKAASRIFGLRREERLFAAVMLLMLVAMNSLVIIKYFDRFTPLTKYYWQLFIRNFQISGFDPITYSVVSDWTAGYNVYRHPLLAFYMYVPYLINQLLMRLTGINCAIFIVAAIQIFFGFYAMIFLRRIMRDIVGLDGNHATLMTVFCFSFAFVMLSSMVPDHFIISMMLLLLTLHLSGQWMKDGRRMTAWHTIALFMLTAGTSLNNGLKTFMSALFVNGRRFFRPSYILAAVILPSALLWTCSRLEYDHIVWPRDMARNEAKARLKAKKEAEQRQKETMLQNERKALAMTSEKSGSAVVKASTGGDTASARASNTVSDTARQAPKKTAKPKKVRQGKPISNGEFMRWTDISTSRTMSAVENLFGESIQLHKDYLLMDEFRKRPMIVHYSSPLNYVIEAVILFLFAAGVWFGRRSRFMWLVMSYFMLDMALHMGLGFGINEVYIMSAHWIYAIPIATAYILTVTGRRVRRAAGVTVFLLTCFLLGYNITLIASYLL